ncbi:4675_t:CDS:1 [Funneliformis geosporum]|uniref:19254_t:CDS:1 n=1 Tax=Funneliformis geosporum TaxID=1117311 RepID=A0A9W4SL73_9GLOM|nr:4675_t:CDS:1 [Funneliformis geosporum]CAI2171018.1 19254_t:CDS:1 [Funneliformis geosporum]
MSLEYQNQNIGTNEFQQSSIENNNTLIVPSSQLITPPMEGPYTFGGENCFNQEFCYYYYNNQLTPESTFEQTLTDTYSDEGDNGELYINDQENSIITWSPELEIPNHYYIMDDFSYLYNNIAENNPDSFNSFVGQSFENSMTTLGENLLLTQPLSEITQNIIENQQQYHPYDWCDLSSVSSQDMQQQYVMENNISSKITDRYVNNNNQCISSENYYTPWTDFQLLEA